MRTIKFHFFSGKNPASLLIRARLGSIFSHVGIQFNELFFDSTMTKGVTERRMPNPDSKHCVEIQVTQEQYDAALKYARSQVGKKYDWLAILGFFFGFKMENSKGLFCSEYGRFIFETATGVKLKYYNLVAPGQLRLMVDTYRSK